ncbi:px domain-containing protein [Apiospora phragmitis]|uniref:Px domain-containing protein n=1 Tax=Apiospora phragmitis TaxID=2905665 RepID=A0ABR1TQY8_9PEZI
MGPPTMTFGTSATPTKQPTNGYFTKGQWHCNCQPRLPAVQFQVRRKTKNEGRWFYTCQKDRSKGTPGAPEHCGFFLFAEDARLREEGALFNNSDTEPSATQTPSKRMKQTTLSAAVTPRAQSERRVGSTPIASVAGLGRQVGVPVAGVSSSVAPSSSSATMRASDKSDGTAAQEVETDSELEDSSEDELSQAAPSTAAAARGPTQPTRASAKRKRPADESDDDEFGGWSSDEERQAAFITDSTTTRGTDGPGRKIDAFATPAVSRTLTDTATGLATPSLTDKPIRRVLFAEPEIQSTAKRQRTDEDGSFTRPATATPSSSQESATTPGSHAGALNVTDTVMGLLKGQKSLSDEVRAEVRLALQKFEARAKGLERGRDASRQAGKKLEERIAKQQARIVDLENQRKMDAESRQKMRSGMMKLYSEV